MKKILTILLVCLSTAVTAQVSFSEGINGRTLRVQDINGKSLIKEKYNDDIEGSPFLNSDWAEADLVLRHGKEIKKIQANLNVESNELYIKDSTGKVLVIQDLVVTEIAFTNRSISNPEGRIFRNGYPPVDKQSVNFFYEVLADGRIQLLRKLSKNIDVIKNELSGEVRKEFVENNSYYVLSDKGIENFRYQKEFVLDLLKDKQAAVDEYVKANKINFKKIPDVQKLLIYYNGLK
jgi:hypothetical protein